MHLLATEPGTIADGSAAVDLGQTPGDILVLASADTEIALLAAAQARRRAEEPRAPSLRLAPVRKQLRVRQRLAPSGAARNENGDQLRRRRARRIPPPARIAATAPTAAMSNSGA